MKSTPTSPEKTDDNRTAIQNHGRKPWTASSLVQRLALAGTAAMLFASASEVRADDTADEIALLRQQLEVANRSIALQQRALEAMQAKLEELELSIEFSETDSPEVAAAPPASPDGEDSHVKVYGYVKLDASLDSTATNNGNLAMWVKSSDTQGSDGELNMTAKQSRLGLMFDGYSMADFDATARLEMDFYGSASENAPSPRLRLAYMTLKNERWELLAGQDWDASKLSLPTTVNFATLGNSGALWSRRPQIRLSRFDERSSGMFTSSLGLARTIGSDLDGAGQEDGKDAEWPTLQGRFSYSGKIGDREVSFGFAGHYGTESVDYLGEDTFQLDTYSLSLQAGCDLDSRTSLNGVLWQGSNLANYHGGIGQGVNPFTWEEIDAWGGWVQLSRSVGDRTKLFLTYGIDNPNDSDLNPGGRSLNQVASLASYFSFSKQFTWATEFSFMKTDYLQQSSGENFRLQNAVLFKF